MSSLGTSSISIRNIDLSKTDLKESCVENIAHVARMYGKTHKLEEKVGKFGDDKTYFLLHGEFEAINILTGEFFHSRRMILPTLAEHEVVSQYQSFQTNNEPVSVEFGFDISVKFNPNEDSVGYEFLVASVLNQGYKPLEDLKSKLPELKMIAPSKTTTS